MSARELFGQAAALHQRGQFADAERLYRRILAANPRDFDSCHMLGVLKAQQGVLDEAQALIAGALKQKPNDAGALANYANILTLLGRAEEAVACYDRAIAIAPDTESLTNRGNVLHSLNRHQDALSSFDRALTLDAGNVQAQFKRGTVLGEMGRSEDAIASYDRVLARQPGHIEALNNRGFTWWLNKKQYAPAIADLQKVAALAPDFPYARGAVLHLKMYAADWTDFERRKTDIVQGIRRGMRTARPFMFQAVSDQPADLQTCARIYARDQYPEVRDTPLHDRNARAGREKIRLGYLSGEFREQATAILMAGLYERHDRARFEVIAVDNGGADNSAMRKRLEKSFDSFLDIEHLSDADAAAKIRAAGIDILINLNGYFGKHRMGVFARRPAPLQVNYLGFPGTLGAPYIDYILADRVVIPEGEERFYDEKLVLLPGSYQVNDNKGRAIADPPSRAEAGLPDTGFVFCNFNQSYKLTPDTFASWMRILRQVDGSLLWLLEAADPFADNIRRQAQTHGVTPERIIFAPDRSPEQHLARLKLADLFLDGQPYNAHTTGSDALWAGVPLITRRGTAFPGRVAASLLLAADLPELITGSMQDYEALAVRLAADKNALAAIRGRLAKNRSACALFDTDLFSRNIEKAYKQMWRRWLAHEAPENFAI